MKYYSTIVLIGVIFCQSGYDIAKSMSNRKSPLDIKSVLVMTLKDKRGNTLESQLISYTKLILISQGNYGKILIYLMKMYPVMNIKEIQKKLSDCLNYKN